VKSKKRAKLFINHSPLAFGKKARGKDITVEKFSSEIVNKKCNENFLSGKAKNY